jgi:hypothetical protein
MKATSPSGQEKDLPVRQIAGRKVIVRAIGQLAQIGPVGHYFEEVIVSFIIRSPVTGCRVGWAAGKQDSLPVPGHIQMQVTAWRKRSQSPTLHGLARCIQHKNATARTGSPAIVLCQLVAERAGDPLHEYQRSEVRKGISKSDASSQAVNATPKVFPSRVARLVSLRPRFPFGP